MRLYMKNNESVNMRKEEWIGCETIKMNNLHSYDSEVVEGVMAYCNNWHMNPEKVWRNNITGEIFSAKDSYHISQNAAFLTPENRFIEDAKHGLQSVSNKSYINQDRSSFYYDDDIIYSNKNALEKYKESRILLIGAGPSSLETESLWKSNLRKYDFIWSCNHFYNPRFLDDVKVDLATLSNGVDLANPMVLERLEKDKTTVGFVTSVSRNALSLKKFTNNYCNDIFYFSTRYFGKIGSMSRLLVLATKLGAKHISFVGVDGMLPPEEIVVKGNKTGFNSTTNVFRTGNPFSDNIHTDYYNLYKKHYVLLWDYILNNLGKNTTYCNYGASYKYNLTSQVISERLAQIR